MLIKIDRRNIKEEGVEQEKSKALSVKEEANKVVHLVDSLYSPHQESLQYEAINKRIQTIIEKEVEQLYNEFVQDNMERMVTQGVKACPSFLDDAVRNTCTLHVIYSVHLTCICKLTCIVGIFKFIMKFCTCTCASCDVFIAFCFCQFL